MSATRDQSQKIGFVYSNLYDIYKKGKVPADNNEKAIAKLEENLKELNTLHARLKKMIVELEDLVKE